MMQNGIGENFWDAHGVEIGACAIFNIFRIRNHFPDPEVLFRIGCSGSATEQTVRQAFRPVAYEILTDVLQIVVPRFFVALNQRVTLPGTPTPEDSLPAVSLRCPCGDLRRNVVWHDPCTTPGGRLFFSFGSRVATIGPHLGRM